MNNRHIPRKRFGQNFLHDQNVIAKIIELIDPKETDQIIEIGPGRGAITKPLLENVSELDIIEIDRDLVAWWRDQSLPGLRIHSQDALKTDYCDIRNDKNQPARIVGNLPYNISTPLLFHLFHFRECITDMHFMLQKEVVERMTAQPGNKNYGRLSIMVQFYCEASNMFTIGADAFQPVPKVDSAIVRLRPFVKRPIDADPDILQRVVTQAFSQRRKTIRNCLKKLITEQEISALGLDPACRPETLSVESFAKISNHLSSTQS